MNTLLKLTGITVVSMTLLSCEDKKEEDFGNSQKQIVEDNVSALKEAKRMREEARQNRSQMGRKDKEKDSTLLDEEK